MATSFLRESNHCPAYINPANSALRPKSGRNTFHEKSRPGTNIQNAFMWLDIEGRQHDFALFYYIRC
jgi:hypothetical protein